MRESFKKETGMMGSETKKNAGALMFLHMEFFLEPSFIVVQNEHCEFITYMLTKGRRLLISILFIC